MKITAKNAFKVLLASLNQVNEESTRIKNTCLKQLAALPLSTGKNLLLYHDALLFMAAHPANAPQLRLVEKELKRLTGFLSKTKTAKKLESSGLPFTQISTRFSQDIIEWILQQKELSAEMDALEEGKFSLGELLRLTLPSAEREMPSFSETQDELFDNLGIKAQQRLAFIVEQCRAFNNNPLAKDFLFDGLEIDTRLLPRNKNFSRTYNRFTKQDVFYHHEILKRFNHQELLRSPLPSPINLSGKEKTGLVKSIRYSLLLMARETDPATYLETTSLRYYALERGIAIAIYGMTAERQMPYESYVGYTLFKNGFPAAYGGSWVFGRYALFGMNIFESFRGGESGYMMCQLLRVYSQAFGVTVFEVEPYQFGKDNPDGIRSGAFWFYYRFGFRPLDNKLAKLAQSEQQKMAADKQYRSSYKTMERFTESYIALKLGEQTNPQVGDYTALISQAIQRLFKGARGEALKESVRRLFGQASPSDATGAMREFALLAMALQIKDNATLELLKEAAHLKPFDLYGYQALLLELLSQPDMQRESFS